MPSPDPTVRSISARLAAYESWAQTPDPTARTAPARHAFLVERFEKMVDPEGVLSPEDRTRRATAARKAHFQRMALASAKARRVGGDEAA